MGTINGTTLQAIGAKDGTTFKATIQAWFTTWQAAAGDPVALAGRVTALENELNTFGITPTQVQTIQSLLDAIAADAKESEISGIITRLDTDEANITALLSSVSGKANQSALDTLTATVNAKANQSDLMALTGTVSTNTQNIATNTANIATNTGSVNTINTILASSIDVSTL